MKLARERIYVQAVVMPPAACRDMVDIRQAIDELDRMVIGLLGKRFLYVLAAARFKNTALQVAAPERLQAMLRQRRDWAIAEGLDAGVIEKMYTDLVGYFIEAERAQWLSGRSEHGDIE